MVLNHINNTQTLSCNEITRVFLPNNEPVTSLQDIKPGATLIMHAAAKGQVGAWVCGCECVCVCVCACVCVCVCVRACLGDVTEVRARGLGVSVRVLAEGGSEGGSVVCGGGGASEGGGSEGALWVLTIRQLKGV